MKKSPNFIQYIPVVKLVFCGNKRITTETSRTHYASRNAEKKKITSNVNINCLDTGYKLDIYWFAASSEIKATLAGMRILMFVW